MDEAHMILALERMTEPEGRDGDSQRELSRTSWETLGLAERPASKGRMSYPGRFLLSAPGFEYPHMCMSTFTHSHVLPQTLKRVYRHSYMHSTHTSYT